VPLEHCAPGFRNLTGADPVKIGAPFNPYRVFQGVFAPYWILEHRGIGAGAKLCYIRLLGFAGRDARCYPSLEKLGTSLGVSERKARDYVKELVRAGLIAVEQRGLRKTNVYLFVWTAELEQLISSVPDNPDDPEEPSGGSPQHRNADRNTPSAPIGIISVGMNSLESSSSSAADDVATEPTKTTRSEQRSVCGETGSDAVPEVPNRAAQIIVRWAKERGIQRLRSDRRTGPPGKEHLVQWSGLLEGRGVEEASKVFAVLDSAPAAADRSGEWRNWSFLTLQIQLASERLASAESVPPATCRPPQATVREDPVCDWAKAKAKIRTLVAEIPFMNWFDRTWQVERELSRITVAVSDEPSRHYLETEYRAVTRRVLSELGIEEICFVVRGDFVESSRPMLPGDARRLDGEAPTRTQQ
jgi:hypothetical protein